MSNQKNAGAWDAELRSAKDRAAVDLGKMLPIDAYELTNPAAKSAQGLVANFSSAAAIRTDTSFVAGGVAAILAYPRNVYVVTGAGGTPTEGHGSVVITGTDIQGAALTETISGLDAGGGGTYVGVKAFKTITSAVWAAGTGTGATQSLGFGDKFGLPWPVKHRNAKPALVREIMDGAPAATAGTLADQTTSPPYGTWLPNTIADGAHDYVLYLERVFGPSL